MTTPALSFGLRKRGRHYPNPPCDVSTWPRNRWGSVDPDKVPEGVEPLPSVTNILSVCDKPALKGWAAERALIELYESGSVPLSLDVAVERHKTAYARYAKQRADVGTKAHTVAESLTSDLPLPSHLSDEDAAYADAFLAWWSDHQVTPLHTEATVYGSFYAGTGDLIAEVDGPVTVVDYKTRGERDDKKLARYGVLYDENRMQLAALARASRVACEDGGWHLDDAPLAVQAMGVVLFPDGTYATETLTGQDLDRWWQGFRGAASLWGALKGASV